MAWTIGTAEDQTDVVVRPGSPALRWLALAAWLALIGLGIAGQAWAWPALLLVFGAQLLGNALRGYAEARPPQGGPVFAISTLGEGRVEVVGRIVPPKHALLSPLTSTKCSFFDYRIELLDEASGERAVIDEGCKLTDFWLKDITGSIWVETEGIDIRIPAQLDEDLRTYDQTPRAVGERLQKLEVDPFLSPGVRRPIFFRETRLDPGDNMLVCGDVVRRDDGQLVLKAGADGLSVERWNKPTFIPVVDPGTRGRLYVGIALLLAGAVWLGLRPPA